jgi:hypothetical protein
MTEAVWTARANNPYYRMREMVLPAFTSAGVQQFEFETTFLPHTAGHLLVRSQCQERDIEIIEGQPIEFEGKTEWEIVNMTEQELKFTVMEYK